MTPFVSFQIPTYRRMDRLPACLESILGKANNPQDVEILLRVTDTDRETMDAIPLLLKMGNVKALVGPRKNGYSSLTEYHDEIAQISTGEWLWQWNDDVMMLVQGWDGLLSNLSSESIYLPDTHRLGGSTYHRDARCPFLLMHASHWNPMMGERNFGAMGALSDLVAFSYAEKNNMPTKFIAGLAVHHLRDTEEQIAETRK